MNKYSPKWQNVQKRSGIRYQCGYCDTDTSPSGGWSTENIGGHIGYVLICTNCNRPSFVETHGGKVTNTVPTSRLGNDVMGLPEEVESLYREARDCTSAKAYTSAVLTCRKILMHVAVEKGADEGKKFIEYVDYLSANSYIPPDGKAWVDHIRTKANEANHEIVIMSTSEADDLVAFTEMLLRLIYEFPHRLKEDSSSE